MSMLIEDFINEVSDMIHGRSIGVCYKRGVPEYIVGMGWMKFDIEFEIGGRASWQKEGIIVRFGYRQNFDLTEKHDVEGYPLVRKITPMDKEVNDDPFISLRWKGIGNRSIARSLACVNLYQKVLDFAAHLQIICDSHELYDEYYERSTSFHLNQLDRWTVYQDASSVLGGANKDKIVEACSKYNLPVSGTKDELRNRLFEHAKEYGDHDKYMAKHELRENRLFKSIEAYEAHMEELGRGEYVPDEG